VGLIYYSVGNILLNGYIVRGASPLVLSLTDNLTIIRRGYRHLFRATFSRSEWLVSECGDKSRKDRGHGSRLPL